MGADAGVSVMGGCCHSCVRTGHGLGAKDDEADRWVAAVAVAGGFPLATEDTIFDDVRSLRRKFPDA